MHSCICKRGYVRPSVRHTRVEFLRNEIFRLNSNERAAGIGSKASWRRIQRRVREQIARLHPDWTRFYFFLDAPSHLYKRSCPSARPSVRASVRRSVPCYFWRWKVRILGASCAVYPSMFFFLIPHPSVHPSVTSDFKQREAKIDYQGKDPRTSWIPYASEFEKGDVEMIYEKEQAATSI